MNDLVMPLRLPAEPPCGVVAGAPPISSEKSIRFRAMVDEHFDFIWRSLRGFGVPSHSVDDAAQQVFWIASQKIDRIASGSERSFLFGTARGVSANMRRAKARSREVLDERAVCVHADEAPSGETMVEMREQRAMLDQVLASMSDDLREVFVLFVLEGMETPEIAELVGIPAGTVASRLRRARETFHALALAKQRPVYQRVSGGAP